MQDPQFRLLREGDTFAYDNPAFPFGDARSHWEVTGAAGTDLIDAKCIDPLPYDTAEEIFYISQAPHMVISPLRSLSPIYIEPNLRGEGWVVRWSHQVLLCRSYLVACSVEAHIAHHADWPEWAVNELEEEVR